MQWQRATLPEHFHPWEWENWRSRAWRIVGRIPPCQVCPTTIDPFCISSERREISSGMYHRNVERGRRRGCRPCWAGLWSATASYLANGGWQMASGVLFTKWGTQQEVAKFCLLNEDFGRKYEWSCGISSFYVAFVWYFHTVVLWNIVFSRVKKITRKHNLGSPLPHGIHSTCSAH